MDEFDDAPLAMIRRVGRDTLARKMIDLFLASGPERAKQIQVAHAAGDFTSAGKVAHSLKSSAGQLGAIRLQRTCQRIEDAGRANDGVGMGALLPELSSQMTSAEAWLRAGAATANPPEEK
jgi:HPt (histidine-containing phosphotransfer) domain-containing protein